MMLGVHCSISGGIQNAFEEAARLEIDTFQIFTRNQRQWKAKPVSQEEAEITSDALKGGQVKEVFSHCSYLINLAAADTGIRSKSVDGLIQEVSRCTTLGLPYCVLHPGASGQQTREEGIALVREGLGKVVEATRDSTVMVLLEITAGQGSSLGGKIEHLHEISRDLPFPERIGFCIDTCHAFAAGYDIRTTAGIEDFLAQFNHLIGVERIKAFHFNDSKGDLGSHLDRHEHIGQGKLGIEPFRYIISNFPRVPKVLETPKENDMDLVNLRVLRELY